MSTDLSKLQEYKSWVGQTPDNIRKKAIKLGGWAKVFPDSKEFPLWASRVRNYFNVRPKKLTQLGTKASGRAKTRMSLTPRHLFEKGVFKGTFSLSGDVYEDEDGLPWFEMSTVATIYHFKGKVDGGKKLKWFFARQKHTPVFKLISPDGTGGSLELVLQNLQYWGSTKRSEIGPVGKTVNILGKVVIDERYQGSYNYSDNGVAGVDAHEHRDIDSHVEKFGFYVPAGYSRKVRKFPENDPKGRPIANSEKHFKRD